MKKALMFLIAMMAVFSFSFTALASENTEKEISDKLFSGFDSEISDVLEDFGITSLDYESIYSVSAESIFSYYKDRITDYAEGSLSLFAKVFAIIIAGSTVSMLCDEQKYKDLTDILFVPFVVVMLVDEANLCLNSALTLLKLNSSFMLSFVPIYAVAIAVAGNPGTALTYNSLVLGFGEIISATLNYSFVDIIGCILCVSIGFSLNRFINFPRFLSAANRFVTFCLGLLSSVFGAMLSVKGIFSATADSAASKGIRFAIGSLIPVIGSSISDAYSTVLGSFAIIKSSVAIVGILAVLLINLPVIAEIVIFNISLNTLSFIGEVFGCNGLSNLLKAFAFAVKLIGLLIIFEAFILIVSTAVMLTVKGG